MMNKEWILLSSGIRSSVVWYTGTNNSVVGATSLFTTENGSSTFFCNVGIYSLLRRKPEEIKFISHCNENLDILKSWYYENKSSVQRKAESRFSSRMKIYFGLEKKCLCNINIISNVD